MLHLQSVLLLFMRLLMQKHMWALVKYRVYLLPWPDT